MIDDKDPIADAAFRLCKAVKASKKRPELSSLFRQLLRIEPFSEKNQARQFFSYFLQPRGLITTSLSTNSNQLLCAFAQRILKLNQQCVLKLTSALPTAENAVLPYESPSETCSIAAGDGFETDFFTHEEEFEFINTYQKFYGPYIESTLRCQPDSLPKPEYYNSNVKQLLHAIEEAGIHKSAEGIKFTFGHQSNKTLQHIGLLTCLRDSLENLNQLLFQAVLEDNLRVLTESNIVSKSPFMKHFCGTGVSVAYSFSNPKATSSERWVMLVNFSKSKPFAGLYLCERTNFDISEEYGSLLYANLRKLEYLSRFTEFRLL